ncbi:MAG: hypothetical protein Q8S13_09775, partial [Dehalococcoidia bacterium]|nr:hypothetical protein [Dehalococcoidia bacterium]
VRVRAAGGGMIPSHAAASTKHQIPITKESPITKHQSSHVWLLDIGDWNFFGDCLIGYWCFQVE